MWQRSDQMPHWGGDLTGRGLPLFWKRASWQEGTAGDAGFTARPAECTIAPTPPLGLVSRQKIRPAGTDI